MVRKAALSRLAALPVFLLAEVTLCSGSGQRQDGGPAFAGGVFSCLDGSVEVPAAAVDDDFCDCPDGSDELRGAACAGRPAAVFECRNFPSLPTSVPASRVNDGICDCCDGSDERGLTAGRAPAGASCPDACEAQAAVVREHLEGRRQAVLAGLRQRRDTEDAAASLPEAWRAQLAEVEANITGLETAAEEVKRLEAALAPAPPPAPPTEPADRPFSEEEAALIFSEDFEGDAAEDAWKVAEGGSARVVPDPDGLRGRVLALSHCTWGGDAFSSQAVDCTPATKCKIAFWARGAPWQGFSRGARRTTEPLVDAHSWLAVPTGSAGFPERLASTASGSTWAEYSYLFPAEDSFSMFGSESVRFSTGGVHIMVQAHSSTGHCEDTMFDDVKVGRMPGAQAQSREPSPDNRAPGVSEYAKWALDQQATADSPEPPLAGDAAVGTNATGDQLADVADRLADLERRLRQARGRRLSLNEKLKHAAESPRWVPLIDECLTSRVDQHMYSVCFFGHAKQGSVSLGSYEGWDPVDSSVMLFTGGQRCHDGPARSLRVRLSCGPKGELLDVSEPSRCIYEAEAVHPNACSEEDLQRTEADLAKMGPPPTFSANGRGEL